MPSRPHARVFLVPEAPSPGDTLRVRVELESQGDTRFDAIDVGFIGDESRYKRTVSSGKSTVRKYHRREIVRLGARFEGGVFSPGLWSRDVEFSLPAEIPPNYHSGLSRIDYAVTLRVWIPWWPDLEEQYPIAVRSRAVAQAAPRPKVFTTQAGDHRGDEPIVELSLASELLAPGGTLAGSVAVTGLQNRKLRRIEIACIATESALVYSSAGPHEANRRSWVVLERTPEDGESIPFELSLPEDIVPTFKSPFIRVDHALEARAVVAFGRDVTVQAPVFVARTIAADDSVQATQLPLVGRARHVAVWRAAVERAGAFGFDKLVFDAEQARATFEVPGVRVAIAEEHREGLGPCLVAALRWAPLAVDLRLAERKWTDLGGKLPAIDAALQKRFRIEVREAAQVEALLSATTRDGLALFDEVGMDDDGAVVLRKGGVYQLSGLDRFFALVHDLARHLSRRIEDIPPPAALADALPAFEQFARARDGQLRVGDLSIHGWAVRGVPLSLTHRFERGQPSASMLLGPRPERADPDAARDALALATDLQAVAEGTRVGVLLPLVTDPARVESVALSLAEALLRLSGGSSDQPYR